MISNAVIRRVFSSASLFGTFLFIAYMLAKAPLLLWGEQKLDVAVVFAFLVLLQVVMLVAVVLLLANKKIYACIYVLMFNFLFFLGLLLFEFSGFGFYKYASLSILLSLVAIVYCVLPARHTLAETLLMFAGILVLYGCLAALWGGINGQQFALREATIGINGPIVFGQLMIVSSVIFFLYGDRKRIVASVPAALSLLSYSKGPILAGLFILFLRRKVFFTLLALLAAVTFLLLPDNIFDNRIFYFIESVYSTISSGNLELLFGGANYGSVGSRLEQYILAIDLLAERPLGIGLGQWQTFSSLEYPHNYLVEILAEQGLILGVASLSMVVFFFSKIYDRNLKYLFLMFFLFSMFSGSIIDNRGIYLVVLLGLLYRESDQ